MAMEETPSTTFNFPQGMGWQQKFGLAGTGVGLGAGALAAGVLALLGVRLNGIGVGNGGGCDLATQRDLGYERSLSEKGEEIASLKAQLYTDTQVNALRQELTATSAAQASVNASVGAMLASLNQQAAQFQAMQMSVIKPSYLAPSEAVLSAYKAATAPAAATASDSAG